MQNKKIKNTIFRKKNKVHQELPICCRCTKVEFKITPN